MRLSQSFFYTLREVPSDADIRSHQLLVRAGYIRRLGSGSYSLLPLMQRVIHKIEAIVRDELDRIGGQECLLPQMHPDEVWEASGRLEAYRAEGILFHFQDRQNRGQVLAPTHEEAVTLAVKDVLRSYRQYPVHLYQIQTKFRDEIRPRFGLMRSREFIMKDGYSFHTSAQSLEDTYQQIGQAYERVFERLGIKVVAVEADSGAMGGKKSREFMVLTQAGEDEVLYTADGQYAANVEKAESIFSPAVPSRFTEHHKHHTPGTPTIATLCDFMDCDPTQVVKNVLYQAIFSSGVLVPVLVSIRGDQDVNPTKLSNVLSEMFSGLGSLQSLEVPDADQLKEWTTGELPLGYIAPDLPDSLIAFREGVHGQFARITDFTVSELENFVTGANETDHHVYGANWGGNFQLGYLADVRMAKAGDRAKHDPEQTLLSARGVEVGHIFQLGNRYADRLGLRYLDAQGQEQVPLMGCYGMGITRLAQAIVEQSHDEQGIIWPLAAAPYQVILTVANMGQSEQAEKGLQLYQDLKAAGLEVMLDDRDERAGVKFKDADLIGIPFRVVVGKTIQEGLVELITRQTGEKQQVALEDLESTLSGLCVERKRSDSVC
ncbi:proline--tRNA ligase [Deinococcus cellulosilyticus]|uniref:Proline--tRNA ligase n=1 Tax=Deinococcus cellulosilyticus (strain DSM 18568 / NBRC 106333 / KACC 11606 / 5516J-15) TaxID=1223518 RepID=A0A511MXQ6_DEIC1|nr:proline--tRNA ligase [Deinococcus cellulosilyticus]GEM45340.1 proline--tRNA ligase [Deinococcus cellulosilyticus NBRC 106333 = KACC 11606]